MKKNINRFSKLIILAVAILAWVFSFYKIVNYLRLTNIIGVQAASCSFEFPEFPCSPPCDLPSCCPPPCATPTPELPPDEPTPTPTPPSEEPPPPGNGGPPDPPGPPVCGATTPPTPILLSVMPTSSVDLSWTTVSPATHYSISYGPGPGDYLYGVDNTGNVTSFHIGGLEPGQDYCFAVRAVNNCAPGELSNEICTGSGQVLGVSTLADTGQFLDHLYWFLVIISAGCVGLGLRFLPAKKSA